MPWFGLFGFWVSMERRNVLIVVGGSLPKKAASSVIPVDSANVETLFLVKGIFSLSRFVRFRKLNLIANPALYQ
jgi:hypothetical protein